MHTVILACETLHRELEAALERTGIRFPVTWLPGGEHNVPRLRQAQIQAALDACPEGSRVLLAMTLCGGSLEGLHTGSHSLVVPRCDDCVTLILGPELRRQHPGAYFLTEGWLQGRQNLEAEYRHCASSRGEDRARQIFRRMFSHYRQLYLVDLNTPSPETEARVRELARTLELEYGCLQGSSGWLELLVEGPWPEDRFLVLQPNTQVTPGQARNFMP